MPVTYFTIVWALLALFSLTGLYFFNRGRNIFVFITSQKYLILFLIASGLGMRQIHIPALLIMGGALFWMYKDYFPYLKKCQRMKNLH